MATELMASILNEIKEALVELNQSCSELTMGQRGMLYDVDQELDDLLEMIGA